MDEGTFAYDVNSAFQNMVYREAERFMPDLKGRSDVTIVDYGCGPGENWTRGINMLLCEADADAKVQLVLNDGVQCDWNAVTRVADRFRASMEERQKAHIVMRPGSFYEQIMPTSSVDIGLAFSSFHWMDARPPPDVATNEEYYAAWQNNIRSHARAGFIKLLRLRAKEIKPGGHLLVLIPTRAAPGATAKLYSRAVLEALKKCLEDGLMTTEQYRHFSVPIFEPTEDDLRYVMTAVQDLWSLPVPWAYSNLSHPVWTKLQASKKTPEDYEDYAEGMAGFIMPLYNTMLVRALRRGDERERGISAEEERFLQEFKKRFKAALLSEPMRHQQASSGWMTMRLVRKPEAKSHRVRAKL